MDWRGDRKVIGFKTEYGEFYYGDIEELIREYVRIDSVDLIFTDQITATEPSIYEIEDELYRVADFHSWFVFYSLPEKILEITELQKFRFRWQIVAIDTQRVKYVPVLVFSNGEPRLYSKKREVLFVDKYPETCELDKESFRPTLTNAQILSMFSRGGHLVLDPFAGYGSIPLMCEKLRRYWIAFESDREKFKEAVRVFQLNNVELEFF